MSNNNTTRQPGYYRVKFPDREHVFPARLLVDNRWQFFGTNITRPFDEVEIADPTPIDPNPALKQKLPAAEVQQMGIDYAKSALGMGGNDATYHDGLSVGYYQGFRYAENLYSAQPAPQPAGQLTAEGVEKQLKEFYTKNKDGKGSGFGLRLIKRLINEQTAAKDAEIAKLREELAVFKAPIDEDHRRNQHEIKGLPLY